MSVSKVNYAVSSEKLNGKLSKINALDNAVISARKKTENVKSKLSLTALLVNLIKRIFSSQKDYAAASRELKQYCNSERLLEHLEIIEAKERAERYNSGIKTPLL